ncbi:MAG TPA: AAA family ATPase [Ideonella sp.]|uniref:ATP-dependent nuclease n=1 Tax=Ideonella sp. TaxID=1929293 RepID=UPI002B6DE85D|nr:AAA family ATPase [Ideonella sp.]HSI48805.1 AAA family ATPase [Ideonella sp.]
MYLKKIRAENFRAFGESATAPALDWSLNPGMNILIGENDAGKTGLIDAIRMALWTTSFESVRLADHDFHVGPAGRAERLVIEATFCGLSDPQEAAVLEWLTYEADGSRSLVLNLQARRHAPQPGRRPRVESITRAGANGSGPEIGSAVRDLVRATYLRPLRDAEAELRPGRQSRLSQILSAHDLMAGQETSDFDPANPHAASTLVGVMNQAQHHIGQNAAITAVQKDINENYLGQMAFAGDSLTSQIRLVGEANLSQILERFELGLAPPNGVPADERCLRGLGYNNALFMATELVLLRSGDDLGLLLVEEPEAHLHPQLQELVMDLLQMKPVASQAPVQVVLSTHSPSLAAGAAIEAMTLVHRARTYPLRIGETRLARADYEYLRRFIDATKSNLFFARGVAIVEGPAEAVLLPAIAEMCGLSFSKYGISVVNVGDVGLYHYARVFQRQAAGESMPIPVACITDRDIVPDVASYVTIPSDGRKRFDKDYAAGEAGLAVAAKKARVESGSDPMVMVFVSDRWTLEFDLAISPLKSMMHVAISMAKAAKSRDERMTEQDEVAAKKAATDGWDAFEKMQSDAIVLGSLIYQPLYQKKASKAVAAQYAAALIRSGAYGAGQALLDKLPAYLKAALRHLTGTVDAPATLAASAAATAPVPHTAPAATSAPAAAAAAAPSATAVGRPDDATTHS